MKSLLLFVISIFFFQTINAKIVSEEVLESPHLYGGVYKFDSEKAVESCEKVWRLLYAADGFLGKGLIGGCWVPNYEGATVDSQLHLTGASRRSSFENDDHIVSGYFYDNGFAFLVRSKVQENGAVDFPLIKPLIVKLLADLQLKQYSSTRISINSPFYRKNLIEDKSTDKLVTAKRYATEFSMSDCESSFSSVYHGNSGGGCVSRTLTPVKWGTNLGKIDHRGTIVSNGVSMSIFLGETNEGLEILFSLDRRKHPNYGRPDFKKVESQIRDFTNKVFEEHGRLESEVVIREKDLSENSGFIKSGDFRAVKVLSSISSTECEANWSTSKFEFIDKEDQWFEAECAVSDSLTYPIISSPFERRKENFMLKEKENSLYYIQVAAQSSFDEHTNSVDSTLTALLMGEFGLKPKSYGDYSYYESLILRMFPNYEEILFENYYYTKQ